LIRDDAADDDLAFRIGLLDLVPDLHLLGLLAREHDVAFAVFGALEQHVDRIAGLHSDLTVLVEEFADGDDAFGLVADVDYDFRAGDLEHCAFDDFTFRDVSEAVIVNVQQLGVFLRIHVVIDRLESRTRGLPCPGACWGSWLFARLTFGRQHPILNICH